MLLRKNPFIDNLDSFNTRQKEASCNSRNELMEASERKCKESNIVMGDDPFNNSEKKQK